MLQAALAAAEASGMRKWPKLVAINLVTFGLDLCSSAGFTYIPPLMLKSGFPERSMTITMGIGPFISLFLVPLVGRWSDTCQSCLGRRRPFILGLSLLLLVSLLLIPYSQNLGASGWLLLAVGVILLDFTSQALMNPCKALVSDMIVFSEYQKDDSAFTTFSCMLCLGGCLGYLITSLNWGGTRFGELMGSQEKAIFVFLAVLFLIFLVINMIVAKEVPYKPPMPSLESNNNSKIANGLVSSKVPLSLWRGLCVKKQRAPRMLRSLWMELFSFFRMPAALFRLFAASLVAWMGIMCHDMFYTDFVGQVIYKGNPQDSLLKQELYDQGVRMGSWGLLLHCLSAAIFAMFFQSRLSFHYGQECVYMFGMVTFTISMLGTVLTTNLWIVNGFAALSGIALAVLTTIPYNLVTTYFIQRETYYPETSKEERGIGKDLAVLDAAYYLAQIFPSMFMGHLVEVFDTSAVYMVGAVVFGLLGCMFSKIIIFPSREALPTKCLMV